MNKRWGDLANRMGTLVEDIVAPSVRRLAREVFDCGGQRRFGTRESQNRSDDLSREREFALYFPQYRELPIVPAFSSLSIPQDMVTYLTRRGIYAIAMGDEAMQVLNPDAVRSLPAAR